MTSESIRFLAQPSEMRPTVVIVVVAEMLRAETLRVEKANFSVSASQFSAFMV